MDTKTLVVEQKIPLSNGPLGGLGTVVKVSPEDVIVRIDLATGPMPKNSLVRFDINGRVCNSRDLGYRGPENEDGMPCSFECRTPWELMEGTVEGFFNAQGSDREEAIAAYFKALKQYQ